MTTLPVIQPSFAAGELSPFLHGRVDFQKFRVGARTMHNFLVHPHGGASNRPGTRYVGAVDDHAVRHRLIPFQFRASPAGQNYVLVFGHLTMQVVMFDAAAGLSAFVLDASGQAYTLATPYAAADLALLKFVQSADTITVVHPSYAPRQLTRTGHAAWTLSVITFVPSTAAPSGLASGAGGTGNALVVTAINDATGEESLPSAPATSSNGNDTWRWTAVPGCSNYNVYKQKGSIFGFVAQVQTNGWTDANIAPDIGNTPPGVRNPFAAGAGSWPSCTTYYQQRQVFANSTRFPQTVWFSNVGAFNNMNVSEPTKDSDAITRALTGRQVNEVRALVECGSSLLIMTSGAEWRCWPGGTAGLGPGSCVTLPQTSHGCNHLPPIWTENALLFVKERGNRVIELRFDVLQDQWQASDKSILSQHLVYDTTGQFQIQEWAWAEEPFKIVWAVRSDGVLLGFTYMREHDVYAWHRHTTDGAVESVCSIPEPDGSGGLFDAVYLIVLRTIGGQSRRYVERMAPRTWRTVSDLWFVDCGRQYANGPYASISGLDHLEGKTVAILGDGSVVPGQVVTNGSIALDGTYQDVIVGLPYEADLETLNLELPSATVQGQATKIAQVTVRAKDTRGIRVGINTGTAQEVKQRSQESLGTAMQMFTGDYGVTIPSEWNREGRLYLKQAYPLPCTILDLIPEVNVGD